MSQETVTTEDAVIFTPARRINQSLTASLEKRVLEWMAHRVPRWLTSDQLTLLGLIAQIGAGAAYALSHYNRYALLLVNLCLVVNWFGDSMDGTLARARCQQRPRFGSYVDHMVDILGATALMCGLGFSGLAHWQVAVAMLTGFLLLSSESYLATYTLSRFQLSQGIFGPTEIRILLIVGNLALLHSPFATVFGQRMLLFDLGGIIAAICMFVSLILVAARHTAQLYREEPLP
jgi:archaetidylinositol phosphate synthase